MALANSMAMKLAGVAAKTPDIPGGVIMRDTQGNPTGIFKDAAQQYIRKAIPPMTHEQRLRAIKRALDYAASIGVTSVQHMNPEYEDIAAYSELAERGELTTRIYAAPLETGWEDFAKIGLRHAWGSSYLRMGALKGFADGSLGSKTAYMFEDFDDDPKNHGILSEEMHPVEDMRDRLSAVERRAGAADAADPGNHTRSRATREPSRTGAGTGRAGAAIRLLSSPQTDDASHSGPARSQPECTGFPRTERLWHDPAR